VTFLNKVLTRRDALRAGSAAAAYAALPASLTRAGLSARFAGTAPRRAEHRALAVDTDTVRDLVHRAIDAAMHAGASYADARITRTVSESFVGAGLLLDIERLGIGVRVLVDGAWGFAASPYCDSDEAPQLGRDAVAQARVNARITPRRVELGDYPAATGHWVTPIRIDPFTLSLEEKTDFVVSLAGLFPTHIRDRRIGGGLTSMFFQRQERATGTSNDSYYTQTLYQAGGEFLVNATTIAGERPEIVVGTGLEAAGAGWELMLDAKLREQIPGMVEQVLAQMLLPHKPVEIGRYDVVCDAVTIANLVDVTIARATQIDRSLGYEANAGGTSYLGPDPMAHLGTTVLGAPLFTVTGDRQMAGGLATVKWDDEGVEPDVFPIIKSGRLVDYQTTREQVAWLEPWYKKGGHPGRSHGCAWSSEALDIPLQTAPNLTLEPGAQDLGFEQMVAGIKKGLAITKAQVSTDFQSRNGSGGANVREIVNGKLGAVIDGSAFLFDSTHLWKNLVALGGASSRVRAAASEVKGQPSQLNTHSISAVPAVLKDMIIVDSQRGF